MKKINLCFIGLFICLSANAQEVKLEDMNSANTWIKAGIVAGIPVSSLSNVSSFSAGPDLSIQFLRTKAYGIGVKTGYLHYFSSQDNVKDFSAIPLALMFRYYPTSTGFFTGIDVGYAVVTNLSGTEGGAMYRPQLGYHGDNWNFFGYYDHVITEDAVVDLQSIGIGITYNIRWDKKK